MIQISMVPRPYTNSNYRTGIRSPGRPQHRVSYPQPQQKVRQEWLRPASASPQPSQQRQKQMQMPQQQQHQYRTSALQGSLAKDHMHDIPVRASSLDLSSAGVEGLEGSVPGGRVLPISRQPSAARRIAEGMVILGRDGAISPTRGRFSPSPSSSPSLQPPRRATIGDTGTNTSSPSNLSYSTASHHASRLPVLPPKSKNRHSSVDPRSGLASPSQSPLPPHSRLPPPPSSVDTGSRSQPSHQGHVLSASPTMDANLAAPSRVTSAQQKTGAHIPRQERSTGLKVPLVAASAGVDVNTRPSLASDIASVTAPMEPTSSPPSQQLPRPKVIRSNSGSSTNTFGNGGRRSSLGAADLPLIADDNQPSLANDDMDTSVALSTTKAVATTNPSTVRGHHPRPPRAPAAALELSSSSSISTSSIFTESSSSSSISPPSSQGRTQVLQQPTLRSTTPTSSTTTTTIMGSRLPVPVALSIPLSAQAPPTSAVSSKPMVPTGSALTSQDEDRVVDFDLKIQEDVRKLVSAASSSSLSAQRRQGATSQDAIRRREIQETADPLILTAPIVVREDMFRLRDQKIRDEFSAIVLPPLERP